MVTYTPHYLLQFGGSIGTLNEEIWSCGIRLHAGDYTGFDEDDHFTSVCVPALAAWMARSGSGIANTTKLRFAKFNFINAAGHYDDPGNTREHIYGTPVAGGFGAGTLPWQCCLVIGWRTDAATRGRASKGRIYSPTPGGSFTGSTGLVSSAFALAAATSAATLLNDIDAGFGGTNTIRPHIMSSVDGSFNEINSVVVDTRLDIQRRRANNLVGVESTAVVTY